MATEVPEAIVDLVAKEIELTQLLASNDPKTRSDGIKQIKQLLHEHSEDTSDAFQLNDYLIIWRGLFNFMWTSDKPVPQESVTEELSYLIHSCTSYQSKIFFLDAFFLTIKDNWMSIKWHRTNTCMMWVRHCLRQLLFTFVNCDWNLEYMNKFSEILYRALKSFTPSLKTDLQVIFLEELAKVSRGKVPSEALVIILDSFLHYISELNDLMLIREVTQNVFRNLLSPSPDLEKLTAKFQASQKIVDPVNLNNELESVEGDVTNENSNEKNDNPLDLQAGNVSVEIPRINFNPKDVTKVLNKYLTEVDCTRKCLWEITKLTQFYNRLGDCILPNRPNDLKLNTQVLKQKKKKYSSKMVKDGVKRLEMVDSKIKKSGLEVLDHKSLKELNKMGDIVVDRGKIGKSMWKVRHFDNVNTLKENFNLNGSWTVSTIINGINTLCINNDKPPILVPPAFKVESSVFQEKTPKKIQKKVSLTPNFKYLTFNPSLKEINSNKCKSRSKITKINDRSKNKKNKKQNSRFIQIDTPNSINACNKNSLSLSADHGVSATKKFKNSIEAEKSVRSVNTSPFIKKLFTQDNENEEKNKIEDDLTLQAPAGYNVEVPETPENILAKLQKKDSLTPSLTCPSNDSSIRELNKMGEIVVKSGKMGKSIWKVRESNKINTLKENINLNRSWTVSKDTTIDGTNTVCINNSKQPLFVPVGFNVEVLKTPEKKLTKLQKKNSLTPSLTCPSVDSSIKEHNKLGEIVVERRKILKPMWKVRNVDNISTIKGNFSLNGSWIVSKETMIECNNTVCNNDDKPLILVPPGFHVEVLESPEKTPTKVQKKVSLTTSLTPLIVDSSNEQNEKSIQKSNSINKICSSNIVNQSHNNSCYLSDDNNGSASNKVKESNPSSIVENCISLTSVITPDKSSKSFKIQTIEKRVLTRNKNKPDGQNEPISKAKDTSATRVLRKCRKTIAREEISNKALERVRSEAFEDGFGFLRRSHRLSTKTTKELRKCKKTTTRKDISNKALERVRREAFDYGFGSLRRSPRLSTKTTKELQKCRNTTAKEEISMLKPEEISNKALEKVVRKSYKINTLKKNFNVNGSWTVSRDTTIDGTNTLCINDSKQRLLVPVGFNVEVLETPEKTLTKLQKKNSFTPSLTCPSVDSSIKEHNKMGEIVVERRKILKPMWKVRNVDNVSTLKENFSLNGSWIVSKETMIECNNTVCINDDKPLILVPPRFNVEVLESPEKTPKKVQNKVLLTSSLTPLTVDSSNEPNEKSIQKSNSFDKICSPNIVNQSHNNSCYLSADNNGSASNKVDYGFGSLRRSPRLLIKTTKELSKCRNTTAREDISNKALERVRSEAFEDGFGFLRRSPRLSTKTTKELRKCKKTTARKDISNKALERVRSEAFDYGFGFLRRSPRLSTKTTKELQKCKKTTARKDISNKALGRVRSEAFEDGFGFLRRSLRLSIKTDSAKKINEYQCCASFQHLGYNNVPSSKSKS